MEFCKNFKVQSVELGRIYNFMLLKTYKYINGSVVVVLKFCLAFGCSYHRTIYVLVYPYFTGLALS